MKIERKYQGNIEWISKDKYRAIGVEFIIDGLQIKIPRGFIFDGSSVPNIAKVIGIDDDDYLYCACLHDFLYRKKAKIYPLKESGNFIKYLDFISFGNTIYGYGNRKFADLCYKNALLEGHWIKNKLAKRKIYYSYYILRLFGGFNFRKKDL